ncbi:MULTISPECIES: hypothetical protein [Bacillaceae]|uniref:Uncharacterized protein n=1 Tax=Cytobacillus solani TaxID=1637975 RepID=A0A0Q3QJP2_9BACI|nr:hypothetical protein AMS60_24855 [Bacillus sp. FJAT-21945]KQL17792.1 hypothetical protein AN957_03640 [Cytobacillus solani]
MLPVSQETCLFSLPTKSFVEKDRLNQYKFILFVWFSHALFPNGSRAFFVVQDKTSRYQAHLEP